jgi:hypothetical protein
MVTIKFLDSETENKALGFLIARFKGRMLKTGEHIVPEAAVQALAREGFQFTVLGQSTYEQQISAFRDTVTDQV